MESWVLCDLGETGNVDEIRERKDETVRVPFLRVKKRLE